MLRDEKNLHLLMQQLSLNKAWSIKNNWVGRKMTGAGKELLQPGFEKCSGGTGDLIFLNQVTHDASWRQPSSTSSKWIRHLRVEQVFPPQLSLLFFPQVWLFGVQVVMYHITQKYSGKYRQQDGWHSLHKIPQEKLILDQSQEAIHVQH